MGVSRIGQVSPLDGALVIGGEVGPVVLLRDFPAFKLPTTNLAAQSNCSIYPSVEGQGHYPRASTPVRGKNPNQGVIGKNGAPQMNLVVVWESLESESELED